MHHDKSLRCVRVLNEVKGSVQRYSTFFLVKLEFTGSIHKLFAFDSLFCCFLLLIVENALSECCLSYGSIPSWVTVPLKVGDDT